MLKSKSLTGGRGASGGGSGGGSKIVEIWHSKTEKKKAKVQKHVEMLRKSLSLKVLQLHTVVQKTFLWKSQNYSFIDSLNVTFILKKKNFRNLFLTTMNTSTRKGMHIQSGAFECQAIVRCRRRNRKRSSITKLQGGNTQNMWSINGQGNDVDVHIIKKLNK